MRQDDVPTRNRLQVIPLTRDSRSPPLAVLTFRLQRKLAHRCGLRFLTREKQFSRFDRSLRSRSRGIEPLLQAPQACVLSVERRAHKLITISNFLYTNKS